MYRFRTLIVMLKLCLPFLAYHTTFAQAPELYVRGISDDWTVQEKYRMVNDNGVYSLYIDELSSVYTFKICTEDYSLQYGSTDTFEFDVPMACINAYGNNFRSETDD